MAIQVLYESGSGMVFFFVFLPSSPPLLFNSLSLSLSLSVPHEKHEDTPLILLFFDQKYEVTEREREREREVYSVGVKRGKKKMGELTPESGSRDHSHKYLLLLLDSFKKIWSSYSCLTKVSQAFMQRR